MKEKIYVLKCDGSMTSEVGLIPTEEKGVYKDSENGNIVNEYELYNGKILEDFAKIGNSEYELFRTLLDAGIVIAGLNQLHKWQYSYENGITINGEQFYSISLENDHYVLKTKARREEFLIDKRESNGDSFVTSVRRCETICQYKVNFYQSVMRKHYLSKINESKGKVKC